jgi:uncharacterized protein YcaQ
MLREQPEVVERTLAHVESSGPTKVGDLEHHQRTGESWWGWSDAKLALEYLFLTGRLTVADRPRFQRMYDLPDRVHPHGPALGELAADEAHIEMIRSAASAHGVGTLHDLADYYRLKITDARPAVEALVREGALKEVEVDGWSAPAFMNAVASRPRNMRARALLAPFDPVVWFRDRGERLFDFHYRIEIYTPANRRVYGYYVLPFLLGDRIVGRVDLKADRKAKRLLVRGAFGEPEIDSDAVGRELITELRAMAEWLSLDEVEIAENGDLAPYLRAMG